MSKLFKDEPRTMDELRYRLTIVGGIGAGLLLLMLLLIKVVLAFWPALLVIAVIVFIVRALVRAYRRSRQS
jgi:hypothetical protein